MPPPEPRNRTRRPSLGLGPGLLGLALAAGAPGCIHVYEPMAGLHQPVLIDPDLANFQDVRLDIYCPPGAGLDSAEAASLCRKIGRLFENQGAVVSTATRDRRQQETAIEEVAAEDAAPRTDLTLELRARDIRRSNDPVSWLLCAGTFTLVPAVTESTFTQEVIVRDGSGFLLASETLRGRLVRTFGVGTWLGNKVLDWVWRDKEEELTGDKAKRELSQDLYRQISQITFNARMRWAVLQEGPDLPGLGAP